MRHFYYYVPPCPRCGCARTGRYVRTPVTGVGYVMEKSLKAGELIRYVSEVPEKNAYCTNCGNEWPERVELKFLTAEQVEKEKQARGTELLYAQYMARKTPEAGPDEEDKSWLAKLTGLQMPKFNLHRRDAETAQAYSTWETQAAEDDNDDEIIDRRQKDRIEILYTDKILIEKVREVHA